MSLLNLASIVASTALFAVLFRFASVLSFKYVSVYRTFSYSEQGDWSSRANSTMHAGLIVLLILLTLYEQEWDESYLPLRSTTLAQTVFSFSIGYFLFDLWVLIRYQVPLWRVFLIHHVVAVVPYVIYNFVRGCDIDCYLLTMFLLVEFAVIPLNITTILEQLGYGKTRMHTFFFYTTYVAWFAARVVLPLYNIYILWRVVLTAEGLSAWCVIPSAICGHLIAAFCVGVFIFVWTPDLLAKWREPIVEMEEYQGYKLTLRQSLTPRSSFSPLSHTPLRSYGTIEP